MVWWQFGGSGSHPITTQRLLIPPSYYSPHLRAPKMQGSTPIFQPALSFSVSAIQIHACSSGARAFTYWPIHACLHSLARLGMKRREQICRVLIRCPRGLPLLLCADLPCADFSARRFAVRRFAGRNNRKRATRGFPSGLLLVLPETCLRLTLSQSVTRRPQEATERSCSLLQHATPEATHWRPARGKTAVLAGSDSGCAPFWALSAGARPSMKLLTQARIPSRRSTSC